MGLHQTDSFSRVLWSLSSEDPVELEYVLCSKGQRFLSCLSTRLFSTKPTTVTGTFVGGEGKQSATAPWMLLNGSYTPGQQRRLKRNSKSLLLESKEHLGFLKVRIAYNHERLEELLSLHCDCVVAALYFTVISQLM